MKKTDISEELSGQEKIEKIKKIKREFIVMVAKVEKERDEKIKEIIQKITKRKIDGLLDDIKKQK